ncbi:MAG: fumarylacetoacetate hydrolase family protein, partial [Kiloniellales bacterium]
GRHIPKERALDHVIGYSIFNEGSVRDYQFKSSQWAMGKNFDASGSFGPDIVTADELPPGGAGLRIHCRLNGDTVQDSSTDDLIFDVPTLVSSLSEVMTLEPGDVIVTGTPPGVGFVRKPPLFMKPGDTCEVEIEGIGTLRNPVVAEAV